MNKTNVDFAPLDGNDTEPTYFEKYVGVKAVAMPNGVSANDTQLNPTFPNSGTQAARLLAAMLRGKAFVHKTAWAALGISRLAAVAGNLKNKFGWGISHEDLPVTNRFGESTRIRRYMLSPASMNWSCALGRVFSDTEYADMNRLAEIAARKSESH